MEVLGNVWSQEEEGYKRKMGEVVKGGEDGWREGGGVERGKRMASGWSRSEGSRDKPRPSHHHLQVLSKVHFYSDELRVANSKVTQIEVSWCLAERDQTTPHCLGPSGVEYNSSSCSIVCTARCERE